MAVGQVYCQAGMCVWTPWAQVGILLATLDLKPSACLLVRDACLYRNTEIHPERAPCQSGGAGRCQQWNPASCVGLDDLLEVRGSIDEGASPVRIVAEKLRQKEWPTLRTAPADPAMQKNLPQHRAIPGCHPGDSAAISTDAALNMDATHNADAKAGTFLGEGGANVRYALEAAINEYSTLYSVGRPR
jgi:hypothetical protein